MHGPPLFEVSRLKTFLTQDIGLISSLGQPTFYNSDVLGLKVALLLSSVYQPQLFNFYLLLRAKRGLLLPLGEINFLIFICFYGLKRHDFSLEMRDYLILNFLL